jgi:hypothetical protein
MASMAAEIRSFSVYAEKLIDHARDYRAERPSALPIHCIEIGAGRLVEEYGDDKEHLADIALAEIAARWVFPSDR